MNISPISFRSAAAPTFQEMVAKPQTYTANTPAASGLQDGTAKKSPVGKIIGGALIAAVAVVAGIVAGAKTGKFEVTEATNKTLAKVLPYLKTAGDEISKVLKPIKDKVMELIPKTKDIAQ